MSLNPQTLNNGQEQFEYYTIPKRPGKPATKRCQYDYRHTDGTLFSCVAPTLDSARGKRDAWISERSKV